MSGNDDGAVIEAAETAESVENEEAAETAAESSGNKGHGRRLKRAELKELVLQAGFEVLVEEGLGIGIDHITYGKVFDQLEKTHGIRTSRGSVHERIWDSQRDFQLEVAQRALAYRPTLSYSQAIEVALETLEAGDMTTPGSRHRTRLDTVRKGGQASIDGLVNDWTQRIFLGVLGAAATQRAVPSETTSNLQNEVTKSYDAIQETFLGLYRGVADTLQLRPRSDLFGTDHERAYDILTYLGHCASRGHVSKTARRGERRRGIPTNRGQQPEPRVGPLLSRLDSHSDWPL